MQIAQSRARGDADTGLVCTKASPACARLGEHLQGPGEISPLMVSKVTLLMALVTLGPQTESSSSFPGVSSTILG